jgi:hypothetical protein
MCEFFMSLEYSVKTNGRCLFIEEYSDEGSMGKKWISIGAKIQDSNEEGSTRICKSIRK